MLWCIREGKCYYGTIANQILFHGKRSTVYDNSDLFFCRLTTTAIAIVSLAVVSLATIVSAIPATIALAGFTLVFHLLFVHCLLI